MWRRGTAAVAQRSVLVHNVGPLRTTFAEQQLQRRAISTIGRPIGSAGVASRFAPPASSPLSGCIVWRRPSSVATPWLCWRAVRGWSGTSAAHARATAASSAAGEEANDEADDEDEDDDEWDSDDEGDNEGDEEPVASAQPGSSSGKQKASAQQTRGGNTQPRTRDAVWLPPHEYKKQLMERELEVLHDRLLEGQRINADHLARLAHYRCLVVKDPDDGVLQYILDLAKVGHTLGMVSSDVFGLLMGRFAAHNRMTLAEEVYAQILAYRQSSTTEDARFSPTKEVPSIKQKDFEHLITGLAHAGKGELALSFLRQLVDREQSEATATEVLLRDAVKNNKPVDPDTFIAVVRALARIGEIEQAREAVRAMEQSLPATGNNGLMAALNALNDPEGALRVLAKIENRDLWTYVEAVESHLRLDDRDRALALLDNVAEKVKEQSRAAPAKRLGGRVQRATDSKSDEDEDHDDDEDQDEDQDEGDVEQQQQHRHRFYERHGERALWNQVLARLVQNGRTDACFEVWRRMRETEGLVPDNRTARYLVRACVQAKNMARAHQVASNMLKFHKLKIGPAAWNEIIEGYAAEGQLDAMWSNVEKMYKEGARPNALTWEVVERTFKSSGAWDYWRTKVARLKKTIDSDAQKKALEIAEKRSRSQIKRVRQRRSGNNNKNKSNNEKTSPRTSSKEKTPREEKTREKTPKEKGTGAGSRTRARTAPREKRTTRTARTRTMKD